MDDGLTFRFVVTDESAPAKPPRRVKQGLLSQAQLERWQRVFARNLRWLEPLYGKKTAGIMAAGIAWKDTKANGAKTKLEVYGNRQADVLDVARSREDGSAMEY